MSENKSKTKKAGLIGFPLKQSISPAMHNAAFKSLALPFEYMLLETPAKELKEEIKNRRTEEYIGFNVTIPHKEAVIPFLDTLDPSARRIGAVNTVKVESKKLIGYNTDALGFLGSLEEDAGFGPKGKKVVVLGAGGASRAVSNVLSRNGIKSLILKDIIIDKAAKIKLSVGINVPEVLVNPKDLQKHINDADLLVNATNVGMHPNVDKSPIGELKIPKTTLVYDLVYNPYETKLIKDAKEAGAKTCSGLGMLIRQAVAAFIIFTNTSEAPKKIYEIMRKAAYETLGISV